jgi:hypothetical protein
LVVIVDTMRSDSFRKIRAASPAVEHAFARFGSFTRYVTCSSRTDQVLVQVLGDARCDARPLPGAAPSLLEALRRAGYHDRAIRYYGVFLTFGQDEVVRDDGVVVERAKRVLAHLPDEPLALFVHLRGGHNEYDSAGGGTPRERYDRQLSLAVSRAAELVELASSERFVVAVLGDHGEAFGEHLSYAHANMLYEEVLSTPLLIASPTVTPGSHPEPIGCPDVAWELLHGLGVAPDLPPRAETEYAAIDLLPGQFGRAQRESMRVLRVGHEKVIYTPQSGIWELYDTAADPGEATSLADGHPERLGPLQHQLLSVASSCPIPPTVGISTAP